MSDFDFKIGPNQRGGYNGPPQESEPTAWTSTPPTEPGLYHYRLWFNGKWETGFACRVSIPTLFNSRKEPMYHMTGLVPIDAERLPHNIEFWPIPIPEPPR